MGLFSFRKKEVESVTPKRGSRARAPRTAAAGEYSAHPQVDPLLPEKQRARRRLVGALALVLAAVIVLPMVLDSKPKPATGDIAIEIPNQNQAMPPVTVAPAQQSLDKGESVVPDTAKSGSPANPPAATPSDKADRAAPSAAPRTVAPVVTDKPAPAQAEPQASKPAPAATTTTPAADKAGHFVIRIGAFADHQRAMNWLSKLKAAKVPSYVEQRKINGRTLFLLRAGPFKDKASAEDAARQVRRIGLQAQIAEVS
ncbi:MAG: SPOR domain-containing protein [Burkholderiales bacterium]|nr:SPOR domain-containing protein [Burkholderiales bacterium]